MKITYVDGPYRTFIADVPADLEGKEDHLVQLTATGTIELYNAGVAIGVLHERMQGDDDAWSVRLLGKGGTVRVVQDGAVVPGTQVKAKAGGRVEALGAAGRSLGVKVQPGDNGAQDDVIEIVDCVENVA